MNLAPEIARLDRAVTEVEQVLDLIDALPGSPVKTAAIRVAAESLGELEARVSEMRRAEVLRIRDEEQLALAPLAERIGISKARAGQIVKEASDA